MLVINNRDDSRYFAAAQLYTARACRQKLKNGVKDEVEPSFTLYEGKEAVEELKDLLLKDIQMDFLLEICKELSIVITDYDTESLLTIVHMYKAMLFTLLNDIDEFTVDTDNERLQASKLERILYKVANEEFSLLQGIEKLDKGEE